MPATILYLTPNDAQVITDWLNEDANIAWIIKDRQNNCDYRWRAVDTVAEIQSGSHCLWLKTAGPLRIPSGRHDTDDTEVAEPFSGWDQRLDNEVADEPWFGVAAPETFSFTFKAQGSEADDAIGRSGFNWIGNYFRLIGQGAPVESERWWSKYKRFLKKNAIGIPWPEDLDSGARTGAYAFPEAYNEICHGRARDINP